MAVSILLPQLGFSMTEGRLSPGYNQTGHRSPRACRSWNSKLIRRCKKYRRPALARSRSLRWRTGHMRPEPCSVKFYSTDIR